MLYILLNTKNLPGLGSYMSSAGEFLVAKQPQEHPPKSEILELKIHKRQLESVWLAVLGQKSNQQQMNQILQSMTNKIMPTFVRPVLLMDFLTDAYNIGGTPSVVALNGLFELMNRYNLDYPEFYTKLYGLFNRQLLHSRYRSRFFRLVGVFLNSTHLPAALIASFIKRMSRLCVSAPAPGIAIVIPFIYNLLKRHPTCTFMVHREKWDKDEARENGVSDPFDNECEDPWATNALESSLWEIQMLQSHVMPNVATLARVISEQFTKNSYNMEDFMDHTATTVGFSLVKESKAWLTEGVVQMIDGELEKSLKGGAYVEPVVRKKIFSEEERRKVLPLVKQGERLKRRVKESSYESTPPPIRQESESDWEEDPPDDLVCIWGF